MKQSLFRILCLAIALPLLLTACGTATGDASSVLPSSTPTASSKTPISSAVEVSSEAAPASSEVSVPASSATPTPSPKTVTYKLPFQKGISVTGFRYDAPEDYVTKAATYSDIKGKGFDHVRLAVPLRDYYDSGAKTLKAKMSTVDTAIQAALDAGLYVLLDFYGWEAINPSNATEKETFVSIWSLVAERYKNQSDKLAYDLIHHPQINSSSAIIQLNQAQNEIITLVRKYNPNRLILYAVGDSGQTWLLNERSVGSDTKKMPDPPQDDKNVAVAAHCYNPTRFTYQKGTQVRFDDSIRSTLMWDLRNVEDYDYLNCPVAITSFGAVHTVAEPADITEYLQTVCTYCESMGVPWTYCEYIGEEMGARASATGEWYDYVLKGLGLN